MMSTEAHKQLVSGLADEVWNQHDAAAIDRYLGPGLREEVAEHYQQLLHGFPDLQVTVEDDLIAEGDRVVARLTLMAPTPDRSRAKAAAGSLSAGRALGEAQTQWTRASSLAQVVILTVIPQATTEPNQTGFNRIAAQPDLARPYWTAKNRRLAGIS
jgi:hypothetical protein